MGAPRYPSLFQINTRVRLSESSAALGRPATLEDMTDAELDRLAHDARIWRLQDLLGGAVYHREGADLSTRGLYLDMPPWGYHAFRVQPV